MAFGPSRLGGRIIRDHPLRLGAMGFQYRKSISLGKRARVNVSKRGLGLSVGLGLLRLTTRGLLSASRAGFRYTRRV